MSPKALWRLIAVLATSGLAEGHYIYARKQENKPFPDPREDIDKFGAELKKSLKLESSIPFQRFDRFFNDRLFPDGISPRKLGPLFLDEDQPLPGPPWRDWLRHRMEDSDIQPQVESTADGVTVLLKIPGVDGESLKIDVNKERIRISYSAKTLQERRDAAGGLYGRAETTRRYEKVMPVPEGADPDSARTVKDSDVIKVIFKNKGAGGSSPTRRRP